MKTLLNAPGKTGAPTPAPLDVTLVSAPGCHLCEDARGELGRRATAGQVAVREVDAESDEGLDLVTRHRPALFPLVLVDGEFFSAGRLPRRKLDKLTSSAGRR